MGNLYIGEENAIQTVARDQAIQILHVLDLVDRQLRNPDAFLGITKGKEAHDAIILHEYLTVRRCGDHHAFLLRAKDQYPLAFLTELQEDAVIDIDHEDTQRGGEAKRSVREIRIEDLLGREEIHINLDEIGNLLEGKTVLVTGAAGSIGSEICRQLAHFPIKKLVCFDSAETPMHNLRLELEEKYKELNFVPVIGDVRSPDRVDYVFRNWHPQVVFH